VSRRQFVALSSALLATGCSGAGAMSAGDGRRELRVAVVSNPQMKDMQKLVNEFERLNPDLRVRFVTLPENQARDKITQSVATESGQFDVVMVSNYETPIWAGNGWLQDLEPHIARTPGYDRDDIIAPIRNSLTYQGRLHAVPFYGEGSLMMYRKDLFEQAGLQMPQQPTWEQIAEFAEELDDKGAGRSGICLRGLPGWGECMSPVNTVLNAFGGRWFDPAWNAQLTSPEVRRGVGFYVDLVRRHGQVGASGHGFTECLTQFSQGDAAMMYDATSAAGTLEDPSDSTVAGRIGYVRAPLGPAEPSSWLYTWALAVPNTCERPEDAWRFLAWATSKDYVKVVGRRKSWQALPPGSRTSTYQLPEYQRAASVFAGPSLEAISTADQDHPTARPAPYVGLQFLRIPEFVDLGTLVSQQISAAIAGSKPVDEALQQSQRYAETVGETYRR
jgi:sorbitol/mannitol transport system substrate-binding protein